MFISVPTSRGLFVRGTASLYGFLTYQQGTVHWRCGLFIQFLNHPAGDCQPVTVQNLLPGDCQLGMQPIYTVSEPTSTELSAWSEACLYRFRTYLQGTFCQGYSQFTCICFPNLPPRNCWLGVQLFYGF